MIWLQPAIPTGEVTVRTEELSLRIADRSVSYQPTKIPPWNLPI